MPLMALIAGRSFDDATVASINAAYQCALVTLGIKDRTDPVTRLIAETLLAIVDGGVRDEKLLCEQTVAAFRGADS